MGRADRRAVARPSDRKRQLEQRVPALQPLVTPGRLAAAVRGARRRSRLRVPDHRFHHRSGAPACGRRKRGAQNQAIGRSRGGLTSKIHLAVDGLGNPLTFSLTPGQTHDITQATALLDGPAAFVIADKAYDAGWLIEFIEAQSAVPVIPPRKCSPSRDYDKHLYKERHLVECCINKLKQFRRLATRYEKTACNFLSIVFIAAMTIWMR